MTITHVGTAPPLNCAVCRRRIPKSRHVILLGYPDVATDRLLCSRCMLSTKHLHGRFYPDCPVDWHDLHDHPSCMATRAAAAHLLGLAS
jgi:hypothetical protein